MRYMIAILAVVAGLFGALSGEPAPAQAQSNTSWQQQVSDKDLSTKGARSMLESVLEKISMADLGAAARRGDALAQLLYGYALTSAEGGVQQDKAAGFKFYDRSCSAGVVRACASMGYSYMDGDGVAKNAARAMDLFEAACAEGNARACVAAGFLFSGQRVGVAEDRALSSERYQSACRLGYSDGCRRAGHTFRTGTGVAKNETIAQQYFARGCQYGNSSSCFFAGRLLEKASDRSDANRFQAIAGFYERGCDRGNRTSCYNRGIIDNEGKYGRRRSTPAAVPWMDKACDLGFNDACYNLGSWLIDGRAGRKDGRRAIELLGPLCLRDEKPDIQACNNAGTAAYRGTGMSAPDYPSARKFYERACSEGGLVASCRTLSDMYRDRQIEVTQAGEREWLDAQLCFKAGEQDYCRSSTRQYLVLLRAGSGELRSAAMVAGDLCQEGDFAACRYERLLKSCDGNEITRTACRRAFN